MFLIYKDLKNLKHIKNRRKNFEVLFKCVIIVFKREVYMKKTKKILKNFDFEKVHEVMNHLNWVWFKEGERKVPTVKELKKTAKELIKEIKKLDVDVISTGGFEVRKDEDAIILQFVLESSGL